MALEIVQIDGEFVSLRLSGLLRKQDMRDLQKKSRELIQQGHRLRVLAIIVSFEGWEKSAEWDDLGDDMDFMMKHGDDIVKMAFVGDEAWKDQVYMFVGKGLRATEMEFFPLMKLEAARAWVRT